MFRRAILTGRMVAPVLILLATSYAGIPEPPAVLYGLAELDGRPIKASDAVSVIARVSGVAQPIGRYDMGCNSAAGDRYVLKLRIESPFDGQPQSDDAAHVGQTADLFIRVGSGPERSAGQFAITSNATFANQNLSATSAFGQCADEAAGIGLADARSFVDCMTGVEGSVALGCGCADSDADGDSDLKDWALLQMNFDGQQ